MIDPVDDSANDRRFFFLACGETLTFPNERGRGVRMRLWPVRRSW